MMSSFEWNMTLIMGMLLALGFYNHIRIWKIKNAVTCNHEMLHALIESINAAYIEQYGDPTLTNLENPEESEDSEESTLANSKEIAEWDNAG